MSDTTGYSILMSSRYSYSNSNLFINISDEYPYLIPIIDEYLYDENKYWHDNLSLLLMGFIMNEPNSFFMHPTFIDRCFKYFGIKKGKWNKLRKSIIHYLRTNEELMEFKLL